MLTNDQQTFRISVMLNVMIQTYTFQPTTTHIHYILLLFDLLLKLALITYRYTGIHIVHTLTCIYDDIQVFSSIMTLAHSDKITRITMDHFVQYNPTLFWSYFHLCFSIGIWSRWNESSSTRCLELLEGLFEVSFGYPMHEMKMNHRNVGIHRRCIADLIRKNLKIPLTSIIYHFYIPQFSDDEKVCNHVFYMTPYFSHNSTFRRNNFPFDWSQMHKRNKDVSHVPFVIYAFPYNEYKIYIVIIIVMAWNFIMWEITIFY